MYCTKNCSDGVKLVPGHRRHLVLRLYKKMNCIVHVCCGRVWLGLVGGHWGGHGIRESIHKLTRRRVGMVVVVGRGGRRTNTLAGLTHGTVAGI